MFKRRLPARSRIFDVCVLFNEIDLLEIRIGELWRVVDHFVVVESDLTFAGRRKPFFFEAYLERFKPFADKIIYRRLKLSELRQGRNIDPDNETHRVALEILQRNASSDVLGSCGASGDDIALICDVDEIPRPEAVADLSRRLQDKPFAIFELRNHRGYMNSLSDRSLNGLTFLGPVAAPWKTVRRLGAQKVRRGKNRAGHVLNARDPRWDYVPDAGWHISSAGGAAAFWVKAQNSIHVNDPYRVVNMPQQAQALQVFEGALTRDDCARLQTEYLAHGGDPRFRALEYAEFRIDQDIPAYMELHKERFRRFFYFTDLGEQPQRPE
jgi:beta-1,4-mannosyl-glycoprotein beta-1,4-N-acetylglucosaminyltransferase